MRAGMANPITDQDLSDIEAGLKVLISDIRTSQFMEGKNGPDEWTNFQNKAAHILVDLLSERKLKPVDHEPDETRSPLLNRLVRELPRRGK